MKQSCDSMLFLNIGTSNFHLRLVYNTNFLFHKNNYCNVVITTIFGHVRELGTDSFYFCLRMEDGRLGNNVKNISDKKKMEL